jgi:CreA protein
MFQRIFAFLFCLTMATSAKAETVGEVSTNGILFKDTIRVLVFDDPDIRGVSCYITYYDRSMTTENSTNASLSCRKVGPISGKLEGRNSVFEMEKNMFFKTTIVRRFFDAKRQVLVYLSYTDSTGSKNAHHSLSVVPILE